MQWLEAVESVSIRLVEASWRSQLCLRDQTSVFSNEWSCEAALFGEELAF